MSNLFKTLYPEFVNQDGRIDQAVRIGQVGNPYVISFDLQEKRFSHYFKNIDLTGKTVLDIGSALGALGAWVLHHGAKHYHGVELNKDLCQKSTSLLSASFSADKFTITNSTLESFSAAKKYDIVVMSGVLSTSFNFVNVLQKYSDFGEILLVEVDWPLVIKLPGSPALLPLHLTETELFDEIQQSKYSFIFLRSNGSVWSHTTTTEHPACSFSYASLRALLEGFGWTIHSTDYRDSWHDLPELYNVFNWLHDTTNSTFNSRILIKCYNRSHFNRTSLVDVLTQPAQV